MSLNVMKNLSIQHGDISWYIMIFGDILWQKLSFIMTRQQSLKWQDVSDGEIYSGAELTSWTFQWDLTL